jgi:hypothetical protein
LANPADDISQAERRRIMADDRRAKSTYHSQAIGSIDEERGGRYATSGSKQTVIGSSPIAYPQQPSTSPWHHDPIGTEPPLGYSVDAIEPVGEVFERDGDAVDSTPPSLHVS